MACVASKKEERVSNSERFAGTAYLPGRAVRTLAARQLIWYGALALCVAAAIVLIHWAGPSEWRWGVLLVPCAPLAMTTLANWRTQKYAVESAPAIAALRRGQPAQAEQDFIALRGRFRWPRAVRNLILYNLALALHHQGRHSEAIAALAEADRSGGSVTIDAAIASTLALCHTLTNNVELAQSWLTEGRRRYAGQVTAGSFPDLISEVALALRRGQYEEVRRRFDSDWTEIINSRTGETLNPLRILRAFALAQLDGPPDQTAMLIKALEPRRPADFGYLAKEWPELRAFLATLG